MKIKVKVSPETVLSDIVEVNYSGETFGVYSGISNIISGVTGMSSLTGLTVPIMLNQVIQDMGYYSAFDGVVEQQNSDCNFVFSSTTQTPYVYSVYNSSSSDKKFLDVSEYVIDWGDDSPKESVAYNFIKLDHVYPKDVKTYDITLTQKNPWGYSIITKKVSVPYSISSITNPNGRVQFISNNGSWSGTPESYDFIYDWDSDNTKANSIYNSNIILTGYTSSRLEELSQYGQIKYSIGVPVIKYGEIFGVIDDIGDGYTGYTIQNVKYFDYSEGVSVYVQSYSGITEYDIVAEPITKNEMLMGMVDQPQIETNVFVERGVVSPYEKILRIGEVYNLLDLENYGYGYFNLVNK